MKTIILGAGVYQRITGADHQDILPLDGINYVFDLNRTDWPIGDNTFDYVVASHVVEHLNSLVDFMNSVHRILGRGGKLVIETPNAGANPDLEFCDPTHKRCFRPYTFHNYFTPYGIDQFHYTHLAWDIINIRTVKYEQPNDVIIAELTPIK